MKSYKIKIITGYRDDQYYSIDAEEAHKAYYLFLNPEARGVFSNGVAVIGKHIQGIEPDWHGTMGWNQGYRLGPDDYADIRSKGVDRALRGVLENAKTIAYMPEAKKLLNIPLTEAKNQLSGLYLDN